MNIGEVINNVLLSLGDLLTFQTIGLLVLSTALGILFGVLPGLTATLGVALLTGLTYGLDLSTALIMLISMYVGAVYAGSRTAILVNIPGTPSSAATLMDGWPLAQKGRTAETLDTATTASFLGSAAGFLLLMLLGPMVLPVALSFGAFEFALLATLGIMMVGSLGRSPVKGWIAGLLGLLAATVGMDAIHAIPRFTFNELQLNGGIELIPALIGLFAIPEVVYSLARSSPSGSQTNLVVPKFRQRVGYWLNGFKLWRSQLRGGLAGGALGILPGVGGDVAGWMAYLFESKAGRRRDLKQSRKKRPTADADVKYGEGRLEGVIAPENANNTVVGAAHVPMLMLAVPGDPVTAVILGALLLHGVQPGPRFVVDSGDVYADIIAIGLVASVVLLILGLLITPALVRLLSVPASILMPSIVAISVVGAFSINARTFDIYVMLVFGVIGVLMRLADYPAAPMILGLILGPILDENLRRGLEISNGSLLPMVTQPISLIMVVAMTSIMLYVMWGALRRSKPTSKRNVTVS